MTVTHLNLPPSHSSMMLNKISGALEPKAINVRFDTSPVADWTGSIHSPILMGQKPVVNFLSPARNWGCVHLIPMLYSTSFPVAETCSNILKNIETISWGLLATQFGRSPTEISWRPAQICAPVWQFGNLYDLWFEQTMAVTPIVFRIPENGETNEFVQDVPNIYRLFTNKCTVC